MRRRLLGFAGCAAGAVALVAVSSGCSMAESQAQRAHRIETVVDYDARGLVEDIDYALMIDHPSRLTKWHIP
jgi:hypothetical protein